MKNVKVFCLRMKNGFTAQNLFEAIRAEPRKELIPN